MLSSRPTEGRAGIQNPFFQLAPGSHSFHPCVRDDMGENSCMVSSRPTLGRAGIQYFYVELDPGSRRFYSRPIALRRLEDSYQRP